MMSILTGAVLAMGAVFAPLSGLSVSEVCAQWGGNGLSFTTENGVATVTDCDSSAVNVEIPSQLGGCPVVNIGESAFMYCNALTSVKIPDSVTYIGDSAFYGCGKLSSISLPANVTTLESGAFAYCGSLTQLVIPNRVNYIGNYTFYNCTQLSSISIPDSVTVIGEGAFKNTAAYNATSNGVVMIDGWAVACIGMYDTNITLNSGTRGISNNAFKDCTSLCNLTVADTVRYIGASAFEGCIALNTVKLSSRLTRIDEYTFYGCPLLSSITIPDSVTGIGNGAFNGTALYKLSSDVTYIDGWAIDCSTSYSGRLELSGSVRGIADSAFNNCSGITYASIPASVKSIGNSGFSGCTSLAEVVIADGATQIGKYAFYKCEKLKKLTIPSSVKKIDSEALSGCTGVTIYGYSGTAAESFARSQSFSFVSLGQGNPGENNGLLGDTDGDGAVSVYDAFSVLRYDAEVISLNSEQLELSDVNGDGAVNSADALLILEFSAELIVSFPRS